MACKTATSSGNVRGSNAEPQGSAEGEEAAVEEPSVFMPNLTQRETNGSGKNREFEEVTATCHWACPVEEAVDAGRWYHF